jgi:glutamate-1-semialdehyde 2,1-aminomutase
MGPNGRSEELYRESLQYMPGGVNSPVRAFRGLDLAPRFIVEERLADPG